MGVASWGWTFIYDVAKPFLKLSGLSYSVAGFWILAPIFIPFIVRKPGVAFIASVMAALVQSLFTHWGVLSLLWGAIQGIGAEFVFFFFGYKNWKLGILLLASSVSATFSYGLDYFIYNYHLLSLEFNLLQLITFIFSAIFFAGFFSFSMGKRLLRLGLLDQFLIAKDSHV